MRARSAEAPCSPPQARLCALCSAVKDRRRGQAAGSGSSTTPSWGRAGNEAVGMVIGLGGPVSPWRGCALQVSHLTLTDRARLLASDAMRARP